MEKLLDILVGWCAVSAALGLIWAAARLLGDWWRLARSPARGVDVRDLHRRVRAFQREKEGAR